MLAGADVAGDSEAGRSRPGLVAVSWRARGLRRRSTGLRSPEGLARLEPGSALEGDAAALPAGGRPLAPSASRASASARASPTTWASARRSRCSRCCCLAAPQAPGAEAPPGARACWSRPRRCSPTGRPRSARFAPGLRAARRASVRDARAPSSESSTPSALDGHRPRRHQLRHRCCGCPGSRAHAGTSSCSTRRRPSRTRPPGRRAR